MLLFHIRATVLSSFSITL